MIYLATESAIEEMNKDGIDEKDVLMDRAIIKNDGNPLEKLFNVIVEMDGQDKITIIHPLDKGKVVLKEVIYTNNEWICK